MRLLFAPPLVKCCGKASEACQSELCEMSAMILPPAADLLTSLPFSRDRADENAEDIYPIADKDREELAKEILRRRLQMRLQGEVDRGHNSR
jgi:hypothetical protein